MTILRVRGLHRAELESHRRITAPADELGSRDSARAGIERTDPDRLVPDLVAMILHEDVPLLQRAEARDVLELALRDGLP